MSPLFGRRQARTLLYFATDVHGSEKCYRKFLNGVRVYGANVAVLGGDVAGKAIQESQLNSPSSCPGPQPE